VNYPSKLSRTSMLFSFSVVVDRFRSKNLQSTSSVAAMTLQQWYPGTMDILLERNMIVCPYCVYLLERPIYHSSCRRADYQFGKAQVPQPICRSITISATMSMLKQHPTIPLEMHSLHAPATPTSWVGDTCSLSPTRYVTARRMFLHSPKLSLSLSVPF